MCMHKSTVKKLHIEAVYKHCILKATLKQVETSMSQQTCTLYM